MSRVYYNEFDSFAAQWLRNLIAAGLIADGDVDERSITEVRPDDLKGYSQCHFFAGIGGWSLALRLAGWPDSKPVWTGSPPCQPFSVAGKGKAQADERHLWPAFFRLVAERKPAVLFGEQVANAISKGWLDGVFADLEGEGYACGTLVLPACSVDAPHKRDRLWFVADAGRDGLVEHAKRYGGALEPGQQAPRRNNSVGRGESVALAHAYDAERRAEESGGDDGHWQASGRLKGDGYITERGAVAVCDADEPGLQGRIVHAERQDQQADGPGGLGSFWSGHEWIVGADGKYRRVKPGLPLLAHGLPRGMAAVRAKLGELAKVAGLDGKSLAGAKGFRTGSLKGFGNAIVPHVGAEFVRAFTDASAPMRRKRSLIVDPKVNQE